MKNNSLALAFGGLILLGAGCASSTIVPGSTAPVTIGTTTSDSSSTFTRLDLSGKGLTSVQMSVFENVSLQALDLSDNQLTGALPSQIRQLKNLRVLDASGNRMTGVPAEIGQLSLLEDLDLSENQLTGLPNELGNLTNLKRLDLRGNDVSQQDLAGIRAKLTGTEILE